MGAERTVDAEALGDVSAALPARNAPAERRAEQGEAQTEPRVDQDGDCEDDTSPEVVLEEHLGDPAEQALARLAAVNPTAPRHRPLAGRSGSRHPGATSLEE